MTANDDELDDDPGRDTVVDGDPAADPAADPIEFLARDAILGPVVAEHGRLTLDPADDVFERLIVSVLRQQVSMDAAAAIRGRLFDAIEVTPAGIRAVDDAVLREAGLSRQKIRYVNAIADAFFEHGWTREEFERMSDAEVIETLTAITGVGEWTARMQLLFALGREDVFPVGDLGVRKGMIALFDREMTRAEMVEAAERWAPYRSYASLYLWRAYEG